MVAGATNKQKIAQNSQNNEKASRENSKTNSTNLRKENSFYTNNQNPNTTTTSNKILNTTNLDNTNLMSNSIYANSSNISLISNPHNPSTQQFKNSSRAVLSSKQINHQNTPNSNHKIDCLTSSGKSPFFQNTNNSFQIFNFS